MLRGEWRNIYLLKKSWLLSAKGATPYQPGVQPQENMGIYASEG
jgi:hypothetical protein